MQKVSNEIYPLMFQLYGKLYRKNPKDKKVTSDYKDFMADKMLCVDIIDTQNKWGLKGSYYVMERDGWTIDSPYPCQTDSDATYYLLQKDGKHTVINQEKLDGQVRIVPVDKKWKQQTLKNWKDYKRK